MDTRLEEPHEASQAFSGDPNLESGTSYDFEFLEDTTCTSAATPVDPKTRMISTVVSVIADQHDRRILPLT
jgi:hypothetical protein